LRTQSDPRRRFSPLLPAYISERVLFLFSIFCIRVFFCIICIFCILAPHKRINVSQDYSKYFKIAYNVFKILRYLCFDRFFVGTLFFALFRHFVNISVHLFTADRSVRTNGQRTNKKTIETRRATNILYLIVIIIDLKHLKSSIVQDATKQLFQINGSNGSKGIPRIIYITSKWFELIRICSVGVEWLQFLE
jgi:hypothetical protein